MQTIVLFHNSKWFSPIWALLFAMSLLVLWYQRDKWKKAYDTFFWLIILAVIAIYCPLLAKILIPRFLPSYAEYERLAWVFFEIPLISYVLIKLSENISDKKSRYLFVACILIVLVFIGKPDNRDFFKKAQNQYKISSDAITICQKMDDISPDGSPILCILLNSHDSYWFGSGLDGDLYYGIRLYESRFRLLYHYASPEEYAQDDYRLANQLPSDIDYFLCPKVNNIYKELERLGYTYVDESENFAIFHNENKSQNGEGS